MRATETFGGGFFCRIRNAPNVLYHTAYGGNGTKDAMDLARLHSCLGIFLAVYLISYLISE